MIKKILAISGKPGLYLLISRGQRNLIVETIDEQKKRMPAFGAEKVVSLGDISIYTNDDKEVPLASVLQSVKELHEGQAVGLSPKKASQEEIVALFEKTLPNYDTDRVRVSDMRKVFSWYNILVNNNLADFETPKEEAAETEGEAEGEETAPQAE